MIGNYAFGILIVKYLRNEAYLPIMSKLFKVKAKLKQEDPKAGERIRYVSLLVLANDKSKAKALAEEYFLEEEIKNENIEILKMEEIEFEKGKVLGAIIG